jgi:hypothetical protein
MSTWILAAAAICAVLAVLLYFLVPSRAVKIPAIVLGTIAGLLAGFVLGSLTAAAFSEHVHDIVYVGPEAPGAVPGAIPAPGGGAAPAEKNGGGGGGGMLKAVLPSNYPGMAPPQKSMAAGGSPGMMGRGPSAKNQLVLLVGKLDRLTRKPLSVSLDHDRKVKAREQLQGLADPQELSQDQAQKRLDALLELLKDQRETLEAAGFRWPGTGFTPPSDVPNPFKEEKTAKPLASLLETLGKDPGKP